MVRRFFYLLLILMLLAAPACRKAEDGGDGHGNGKEADDHGADANGETAQASPGPSPTPTPDDGKVEFNPRLLLDPKHVADYVVVLEQQVITLQDQSRPAVRINVALEATDEDTKLEIEEKKEKIKTYIEKRVGRMTMGEARTTKAKLQLQEDIVKAANEILDHKNVREAYFVEFATDRQL